MTDNTPSELPVVIVEEDAPMTVAELCHACAVNVDLIVELVEHGVLDPEGHTVSRWRFSGRSLYRARSAIRLRRDLGVNPAGAALIMDLREELNRLRNQLDRHRHGMRSDWEDIDN